MKTKLSEVIQINPSRKLKKNEYVTFVSMQNIKPYQRKITKFSIRKVTSSKTTFKNGDTLLAKITPSLENGKTAFVDILQENECGHGSTEFFVLSGKENLTLNLFVYYIVRTPDFRQQAIQSMTGTSGRQRVQPTIFDDFEINLPSIPDQEKICSILGSIDDQIAILQNQNQVLEQILHTLFKSWFVDFDGQNEFVDSELGKIPKGWKICQFQQIFDINPKRQLTKGDISKYVEMANIPTDSARVRNYIKRPYSSGTKFKNGDTLLARITPCLENGKTAYVDFLQNDEIGWGSTEYIIIHPKKSFPSEYGYFVARDEQFRVHAIRNMTGTSGRQRVPEDSLSDFKLVLPPLKLLNKFAEVARNIFSVMKSNDKESAFLSESHNSLLPKLVSGEISV